MAFRQLQCEPGKGICLSVALPVSLELLETSRQRRESCEDDSLTRPARSGTEATFSELEEWSQSEVMTSLWSYTCSEL